MSMFDTEVWITVLEPVHGRPVAGADVTLFDTGSYQETTGKTDGLGVFRTFVRTSRYVITVTVGGYRDWVREVGIGGTLFEQLVVLTSDFPEPPVDPPVVIDVAIHVNDPSGSPVVGATASLDGMSRITNWAGIAYFSEIGISLYSYVVVADGFHQESGKLDVNNIRDLYLVLTPIEEPPPPPAEEYTLTVNVKYVDGTYAGGIAVSTVRLEGGYSNGGLTNSYGIIQFTNALLGNYRTSVGTKQKEVYLDRDKTVLFQIEEPPVPPNPDPDPPTPGEPPCPNPENIWPWYKGQPYYATPIWKETYKTWNIWHLAEVGSIYGITKPDCVAYSQSSFKNSVTSARAWINEVAVAPEPPEPFTTILDFIVPDSLPSGSDVNVRVLIKNTGGGTGLLSWIINGNPADPDRDVTVEAGGVDNVAPGNSVWVDVYFRYFKMPNWDFQLLATNYGQTSTISKTITLKEPVVEIPTSLTITAPPSIEAGDTFNVSGILYETETGTPIPNQPINHSYNGKNLGTSTTGFDGTYLKEVSVPEIGVWTLKSEFLGTETLQTSKSQTDTNITTTPIAVATVIATSTITGIAMIIYGLK